VSIIKQVFGIQAKTIQEVFHDYALSKKTEAGISVGVNDVVSYAPVSQALAMISGDIAKMKLNVYTRQPKLGPKARDVDRKHQAYSIVKRRANEQQTAFRFWSNFVYQQLLWNNAYAWIKRNPTNQRILGMYILRPDRTQFKDGLYYSEIGSGTDAEVFAFKPKEILHYQGNQVPGVVEPSLLKNARTSISVGLAAVNHAAKFFGGDCNAGGILEIPASFEKKAKDNLEQGFQKKYAGQAFQTVILRDGAKFHSIQIDAEKSQMNETRTHQAREVANWFNMPPSKLGIPDSGGYGSRTEDNRNYYDQTLSSRLCDIAQECDLKLLTKAQQNNDSHYFEHDASALLAMDRKTQAEIYAIESANGATCPDEYRAATNRNPRPDGEGGKFFQPNANYVPVENDDMEPTEEPTEAMAILKAVISEQVQSWKADSLAVIEKECKRKTAGKFSNWFAKFSGIAFDEKLIDRANSAGVSFQPEAWINEVRDEITKQAETIPTEEWKDAILGVCEGFKNV